jgi:hypothetical protein
VSSFKPYGIARWPLFSRTNQRSESEFVVEAVVTVNRRFVGFTEPWENWFLVFGGFSGAATGEPQTADNGVMADAKAFNEKAKVLYISIGTEGNVQGARTFHEKLDKHGIKHVYFESPGIAHGAEV